MTRSRRALSRVRASRPGPCARPAQRLAPQGQSFALLPHAFSPGGASGATRATRTGSPLRRPRSARATVRALRRVAREECVGGAIGQERDHVGARVEVDGAREVADHAGRPDGSRRCCPTDDPCRQGRRSTRPRSCPCSSRAPPVPLCRSCRATLRRAPDRNRSICRSCRDVDVARPIPAGPWRKAPWPRPGRMRSATRPCCRSSQGGDPDCRPKLTQRGAGPGRSRPYPRSRRSRTRCRSHRLRHPGRGRECAAHAHRIAIAAVSS